MRKKNIADNLITKKVNSNYFTGKSTIKEISPYIKCQEQNIYHVFFYDGAKTRLHLHDGGQTLIVTKGLGILDIYDKKSPGRKKFKIKKTKSLKLKLGDIAYIPAGVLHTHGAQNRRTFSHIAINSFSAKSRESRTIWYESDFGQVVSGILK